MSRTSPFRLVVAVAGGVVALGWSASGRAEQFTFFNFEYEATTQNTQDAHYNARPPQHAFTQPDSWRAPIDYTRGTVHIEQDVLTKPSNLDTQVDICFVSAGGRYGCRSTEFYKTTGRVTTVRPASSFLSIQPDQLGHQNQPGPADRKGSEQHQRRQPEDGIHAHAHADRDDLRLHGRHLPRAARIRRHRGRRRRDHRCPCRGRRRSGPSPDAATPPPSPPLRTDAGPPPPTMVPPADPDASTRAHATARPPGRGNPQPMSGPAPASGGFGCSLAAAPTPPAATTCWRWRCCWPDWPACGEGDDRSGFDQPVAHEGEGLLSGDQDGTLIVPWPPKSRVNTRGLPPSSGISGARRPCWADGPPRPCRRRGTPASCRPEKDGGTSPPSPRRR